MGLFENKVVLITGGASGIGQETAYHFAREGAAVVIADVDMDGAQSTAEQIESDGGQASVIQTNVADSESVQAMVQHTIETFGQLDYAVNNAGIEGVLVPTPDYPEDMFRRVVDINLTGVWLCMKYEIPHMLAKGGAIVNVASVAGLLGSANASAYSAAKHGVIGLTKTTALEYAAQGIRVNAVCPAFIETPMVMGRALNLSENPKRHRRLSMIHPMQRLGKAEEIANAIVWLCSDQSSFMTGHSLTLDGGLTAQ